MRQTTLISIIFLCFSTQIQAQTNEGGQFKRLGITLSGPNAFKNLTCQYSDSSFLTFHNKYWSGIGFSFESQFSNGNILSASIKEIVYSKGQTFLELYKDTIFNGIISSVGYSTFQTRFSFEYKFCIQNTQSKTKEYIGIGIYPEAGQFKFENPNHFRKDHFFHPFSGFYINTSIAILATLRHQLSNRLTLDLTMPLHMATFSFKSSKVTNIYIDHVLFKNSDVEIQILGFKITPCIGLYLTL